MARLSFCDYHNMIVILEKYEHNTDFHQLVDFVEASHLRYALTYNPTVYVSHIRQFWSTARIETTDEGTKILATVDGKLKTVSESSIRRNLKLNNEAGISSLPDAELFENLILMGYNISPNQNSNITTALVCLATNRVYNFSKMIFDGMVKNVTNKVSKFLMYPRFLSKCLKMGQFRQITHTHTYVVPFHTRKIFTTLRVNSPSFSGRTVPLFPSMLVTMGKGSGTPTEPYHTPTPEATPSPLHELSSSLLPPVTTEPLPTVIPSDTPPLKQYTKRTKIAQSLVLPPVADKPVSPLRDDSQGSMQYKLTELTDLCTRLQRQQTEMALKINAQELEISQLKARVKLLEDRDGGGIAQSGEDAPIKGMNLDEGEAAAVLLQSLPHTQEEKVARELEEEMARDAQRMNKHIARDADIARIHAEEELQMMIDGLDKNNETVAKYLQEYHQFAVDLPIGRRIKLINDPVKYQDHYAKVLKHQTQQRKPLSRKQQKEFYMSVLKSHAGWKVRHFKGMTLEEIKEKFDLVWKQFQDFIPIGSKEEAERFNRKGPRLEQDSAKKVKTLEEVPEEKLKEMMHLIAIEEVYMEALQVKHLIIDWKVDTEGERSYWKIIRLGGSTSSYQFFIDLLKHFDREDLNQLWALVKETLNIRPATNDKEKELWVELKRFDEFLLPEEVLTTSEESPSGGAKRCHC
nr:hypothetical protein [Tanacetum cinerariifolium]